jgi:hypothetical protein
MQVMAGREHGSPRNQLDLNGPLFYFLLHASDLGLYGKQLRSLGFALLPSFGI